MKYRLIISDFDGTMAFKGETPQETVQAIKKYVEKGGIFVVCTGRTPSSIKARTQGFACAPVAGTHQGSLIMNLQTGEVLCNGGLDYLTACQIIEQVKNQERVIAYVGDDLIFEKPCRYSEVFKGVCPLIQVENLEEELKKRKQPVNRVVLSTVEERVPELLERCSKMFGDKVIVNSGASYIVEIVSPEFTKKQAVEYLANYYNIPFSEVMAVGDSTNDIPLLDGEWHGVAVGTAHPDLKAVADEITVPFEQHPIKYLIEKYCLED